jgi:hypothetical protein
MLDPCYESRILDKPTSDLPNVNPNAIGVYSEGSIPPARKQGLPSTPFRFRFPRIRPPAVFAAGGGAQTKRRPPLPSIQCYLLKGRRRREKQMMEVTCVYRSPKNKAAAVTYFLLYF